MHIIKEFRQKRTEIDMSIKQAVKTDFSTKFETHEVLLRFGRWISTL